MKNKLLSTKRLQQMSLYFIIILLSLGVVFITQGLYTISPFIAGMALVLLTLTTPLALIMAFDDSTTTKSATIKPNLNNNLNSRG